MRKTYYLPRCCTVRQTNANDYEVGHEETSPLCRHDKSGGTVNRIIGHGATKAEAISDARAYLGMD